MIKVPNTTIQLPSYDRHTANLLTNPVKLSDEQRAKNLRCIAKLKAFLNGNVAINQKPSFTDEEKQLTAKDILTMTVAERQQVAA